MFCMSAYIRRTRPLVDRYIQNNGLSQSPFTCLFRSRLNEFRFFPVLWSVWPKTLKSVRWSYLWTFALVVTFFNLYTIQWTIQMYTLAYRKWMRKNKQDANAEKEGGDFIWGIINCVVQMNVSGRWKKINTHPTHSHFLETFEHSVRKTREITG